MGLASYSHRMEVLKVGFGVCHPLLVLDTLTCVPAAMSGRVSSIRPVNRVVR